MAKAEFVLPVPMGSPQNYYGIGCMDTNAVGGLTEPACTTGGNTNGPSGVANATNASGYAVTGGTATNQLNSQGFWGVAFTKGGDSRNGDAYLPTDISNPNGPNTEYDLAGYPYTVEVPTGGGGKVYLFDPGFCGMPVLGSGRAGTGDEWTNNMGGTNPAPVSTYFNLYDDNNTPYKLDDDVLVWASGSTFENEKQVDESGAHGSGSPQYPSGSAGITRCDRAGDPNYAYHLKWFQIPATLAAGNYRLQVTTTKVDTSVLGGTTVLDASENADVGAANRFGIEVTSTSGSPRVYGGGRMAGYANVQAGQQRFYLAQIDRTSGAGKTVEIDLYDPGDVGGGAWLQVLSPDGNAYNPATLSFTSRSKASGAVGPSSNSATCIETNRPSSSPPGGIPAGCPAILDGSGSQFDAYWLQILIPLPSTYGSVGLTPIRRDRGRLVEDPVHGRRRQRHDDLAGQHPRATRSTSSSRRSAAGGAAIGGATAALARHRSGGARPRGTQIPMWLVNGTLIGRCHQPRCESRPESVGMRRVFQWPWSYRQGPDRDPSLTPTWLESWPAGRTPLNTGRAGGGGSRQRRSAAAHGSGDRQRRSAAAHGRAGPDPNVAGQRDRHRSLSPTTL